VVAEPHHFDAAPSLALGKNFFLCGSGCSGFGSGSYHSINQANFLFKQARVNKRVRKHFSPDFLRFKFEEN
jgi:hypothetical protein